MGENYKKKELFYDPLEQYVATSYLISYISSNGSYTGSKGVFNFLLAHKACPQEGKRTK